MPRGDPHVTVGLRLHPELIAQVDEWAGKQHLSRTDALRVLLRFAWKRRAAVALTEVVRDRPSVAQGRALRNARGPGG